MITTRLPSLAAPIAARCPERGQEDVLRLEIAMNDPLVVGHSQRLGHLQADLRRLLPGDGRRVDPRAQALALQELHDDERAAVDDGHLVNRHDARVRERGDSLGLALEPRPHFGVAGEAFGNHLDGNVPLQPEVAGAENLAHSADSD
jgi:hypothetical protein